MRLMQRLSRSLSRFETQDIKTQPRLNHIFMNFPWEPGIFSSQLFSFIFSLGHNRQTKKSDPKEWSLAVWKSLRPQAISRQLHIGSSANGL